MCQHGCLGVSRAATRELEVGHIVRTNDAVEDLQDMLWYALCLQDEFIVLDEAVVIASYETDSL